MVDRTTELITFPLPDDLRAELARMANERQVSEVELATRAIRRFVRAETVPVPRFARRLGPMADD